MLFDYHATIMEQRDKYESQMVHMDKKGRDMVSIELRKLDEMTTFVDPSKVNVPEAVKQKKTQDKFHEILKFVVG